MRSNRNSFCNRLVESAMEWEYKSLRANLDRTGTFKCYSSIH
jgi:hypothetical protein